ncbi:MAG: hypothetical protein C0599_06655 [Salinivirgaceae bacterium]|nr:MAG: hypothetical protein C0599_06655 [Salinivirgaceae bacterium]
MRLLIVIISIALLSACSKQVQNKSNVISENGYDSIMAQKYGADDYGMKQYVMAFLKRGTNDTISKERATALQKAHLENIQRMAKEGKLVVAGPFLDRGELRGIYIFNVTSVEEAKALTETDPAIKANTLSMELKPWYGSAALMMVNEYHEKFSKRSITE